MTDRSHRIFLHGIGLDAGIPTYSGGLGVLAGDTIRAAADLKVSMVAVSLLHRKGLFTSASIERLATRGAGGMGGGRFSHRNAQRTSVSIEDDHLAAAWKYGVHVLRQFCRAVFLLDADLRKNSAGQDADPLFIWRRSILPARPGSDFGIAVCVMFWRSRLPGYRRFHMNECTRARFLGAAGRRGEGRWARNRDP